MENTKKIEVTKSFIVNNAFLYNWNNASIKEDADAAEKMIDLVAGSNLGFASEIAATAAKYKKVSEKQAYHIAKAAVENNLTTIDYMFEGNEETIAAPAKQFTSQYTIGETYNHPKFGVGVVVSETSSTVNVKFTKGTFGLLKK